MILWVNKEETAWHESFLFVIIVSNLKKVCAVLRSMHIKQTNKKALISAGQITSLGGKLFCFGGSSVLYKFSKIMYSIKICIWGIYLSFHERFCCKITLKIVFFAYQTFHYALDPIQTPLQQFQEAKVCHFLFLLLPVYCRKMTKNDICHNLYGIGLLVFKQRLEH